MENRHGLAVDGGVTQATGTAERTAALAMLDRRPSRRRITLGADKAFDVRAFIKELRARKVTPHVAVDGHPGKTGKPRATAVGGRTRRHPGYAASQRCRKRIEEVFGWIKSSAGMEGQAARMRPCGRRLHPLAQTAGRTGMSVMATTRWTRPRATAGLNSSPTDQR